MTQELILGVLLVGIVGLVWTLTCAILGDDQRAHNNRWDSDAHQPSNPEASDDTALTHRIIA